MSLPQSSSLGFGVDIVSISRIRRLLREYPRQFREFAFSKRERHYCEEQINPAQHFAGRWAIKEAYLKAIDYCGPSPDLTTIEVVADPEPSLSLTGDGLDLLIEAAALREVSPGDVDIAISLTHEQNSDIAFGATLILF